MKDITLKDFLLVICNVLFTVTGQLLLKQGMIRVGRVDDLNRVIHKLTQAIDEPVRYRRHRNIRIHDDDLAYYSFESQIKRRLPDN